MRITKIAIIIVSSIGEKVNRSLITVSSFPSSILKLDDENFVMWRVEDAKVTRANLANYTPKQQLWILVLQDQLFKVGL